MLLMTAGKFTALIASRPAKTLIVAVAAAASVLALGPGCAAESDSSSSDGPGKPVSIERLHKLHQSEKDIFVLDVRTEKEFLNERLPFADMRISFDSLRQHADLLPDDTTTTIYIFCRTGRRSGIAADVLQKMGYSDARNVEDGITAWRKAGYETTSGPFQKDGE